jgi:hypothetical protein
MRPPSMRPGRRPARCVSALLVLCTLVGCDAFYSDNENFQRHARAERQRRLAGMRAATAQTVVGRRLEGAALVAFLTDHTHVTVFDRTPSGQRQRYVEYRYYGPGGRFVYVNTEWALNPDGNPDDRWRVDGPRLCVLNHAFSQDEHCYTVAVAPDGRVQFFIDAPGEDSDGLITSVVSIVEEGPPRTDVPRG